MSIEISIIIPVYNDEKYIKKCISSVENQTIKNLEIICIDDESSDASLSVIRSQCELDNRIRVFSQKHAGSGAARNYGLRMARGEYVAFLDADDFYVDENALELMIGACREHGELICGSNRIIRINNTRETEKIVCENKVISETGVLVSFLEFQNDYLYQSFVFNRQFLLDNNINFPMYLRYQDPVFFLKALHYAKNFWLLPCTLYCYRIGHKSRNRISKNAHHFLMGIKDNMVFSLQHGYIKLFEKLLGRLNVDYIGFVIENMSEEVKNIIFDINSVIKKANPSYELNVISLLDNLSSQPKISTESGIFVIDKSDINKKIQEMHKLKMSLNKREEKIVVSLTSYPGRMMHIKYTLYSLIAQNCPADEIVLWLSEEEFPAKEKELPSYLLEWERYGVKVRWTKGNLKSYKKLIPALEEYQDAIIVTADDDIYYLPEWLEILYEEHKKFPEDVIAHRARKIKLDSDGNISPYSEWYLIRGKESNASKLNFITSGGGALFPPGSLHAEVTKKDIFMKFLPNTDDIWFWGMVVLNNRRIRVPEKCIINIVHTDRKIQLSGDTLWTINQHDNDIKFKSLIEAYPMIYQSLQHELDDAFTEKKCIVYGAGDWGLAARAEYKNILFYVDKAYTGKEGRLLDKKIFGPEVLYKYCDVPIVIAIEKRAGIYTYLSNMGMKNISNFCPR